MNESEEFKFAQIALRELIDTEPYQSRLRRMSDGINEYFNFLDRNGITDVDECEIAAISPAGLIVPVYLIQRKARLTELDDLKWRPPTDS